MALRVLVLSASLNPASRSRRLAEEVRDRLAGAGAEPEMLDLRDVPLSLCDGADAYSHAALPAATASVQAADAILVAAPVYNFDLNAALKNFLELTGRAWTGKIVGFLLAAGGRGSYMSAMPFAASLMLDFRCLILPRFVYAVKGDFDDHGIASAEVRARVAELAAETIRVAGALAG